MKVNDSCISLCCPGGAPQRHLKGTDPQKPPVARKARKASAASKENAPPATLELGQACQGLSALGISSQPLGQAVRERPGGASENSGPAERLHQGISLEAAAGRGGEFRSEPVRTPQAAGPAPRNPNLPAPTQRTPFAPRSAPEPGQVPAQQQAWQPAHSSPGLGYPLGSYQPAGGLSGAGRLPLGAACGNSEAGQGLRWTPEGLPKPGEEPRKLLRSPKRRSPGKGRTRGAEIGSPPALGTPGHGRKRSSEDASGDMAEEGAGGCPILELEVHVSIRTNVYSSI